MTAQLPPIPPASRSDKGPGTQTEPETAHEATHRKPHPNTAEQGQSANIAQNTTNKGRQQDR